MELNLLLYMAIGALLVFGLALIYLLIRRRLAEQKIKIAEETAKHVLEEAKKEAERIRKEALLEAKDQSIKLRAEFERESKERKAELLTLERRLESREDRLQSKEKEIEERGKQIKKEQDDLLKLKEGLQKARDQMIQTLEKAAALSREDAKQELLSKLDKELEEESAKRIKMIDEVRYSGALIERLSSFANVVRFGGLALVLLLSFATLLIVVNTIRLTVLAREADISIMKLVGATDSFIKWPFIIEGILIGIMGSTFSISILAFSYTTLSLELMKALPFLSLVTDGRKLIIIYSIVGFVGTLLGMLGGYISVSKSLKE